MAEGEDLGYFVALIFWVISPRARVRSTSRESFGVAGRTQLLGREGGREAASPLARPVSRMEAVAFYPFLRARSRCLFSKQRADWLVFFAYHLFSTTKFS
jgi:hypothetical protein